MKKINQWILMAGLVMAIGLAGNSAFAQPQGQGNQGRFRRGNFDPAQMRQRMMDRVKEQLEITDDSEWNAIQPLIEKVMQARMAAAPMMGRGMFGGPRRGGNNANNNTDNNRPRFGPAPSAEVQTLERAIEGKASNSELKTAIAKVEAYRKEKQAELQKAQADLRKVLSVRQEAIATANGWL